MIRPIHRLATLQSLAAFPINLESPYSNPNRLPGQAMVYLAASGAVGGQTITIYVQGKIDADDTRWINLASLSQTDFSLPNGSVGGHTAKVNVDPMPIMRVRIANGTGISAMTMDVWLVD